MDRPTAMARLAARCAAAAYPTLDSVALGLLLDETARYTVWAPVTSYQHGTVVQPTVRNGHLYRAIVSQQYSAAPAGVSAAAEPIWPLYATPDSKVGVTRPYWSGYDQASGNYSLSMVADNTIVWQEAGPDSADPWDLRAAIYNGWLQKAGMASADYDVQADGKDRYSRSQVIAQCERMARKYLPTGVF